MSGGFLILKQVRIHPLDAVDPGIAVQPVLLQSLVPLQQRTVQHIRHIQEGETVGDGDGVAGGDLIADDELVVDQTAELGGVITGNGDQGRTKILAQLDGTVERAHQQGRGDGDD